MSIVTIERKILEKNDAIARHNRDLIASKDIFCINLISSPGAGKTSILEQTLVYLDGTINVQIIEGDVQTDFDARRLERYNVPVVQIVTNGGCHLEASLVADAMQSLDFSGLQLLIIENVGNLVCPAAYDLGEAVKVVVTSVTEGEDKPLKYPLIFKNAGVMIINKIDLLPHLSFDLELLKRNALSINPSLKIFETSCGTKQGIAEWCEWLAEEVFVQA
ncbi:MAG: hydrogenase nickel incorporation protein HypB [Bacteroidota bacterium]